MATRDRVLSNKKLRNRNSAVTRAEFIAFFAATCVVFASPLLAQDAITITPVPGNPWQYNSDLIFKQGAKEIARQHTDIWGNITPITGVVPDGLIRGYLPDGKLMMDIPYAHNHAEGNGHSYNQDSVVQDFRYRKGILNGTQTGYYQNGKIKTQGEWRDGKPVGLHKLFDEQGRLEMTTEIKKRTVQETRFYPDEHIQSSWTYKDDRISEASEWAEDGVLRIHATTHSMLSECRVSTDKKLYRSGDAVEISLICHCDRQEGCFSPGLEDRRHMHTGWTEHLIIEGNGAQYKPVYCPMCAQDRIDIYSKWLFTDGEEIAHAVYKGQESPNGSGTRWVDRATYSACSDSFGCKISVPLLRCHREITPQG
jgi:antitoxin component YwqK of YwqJK toxin-antitoxin module